MVSGFWFLVFGSSNRNKPETSNQKPETRGFYGLGTTLDDSFGA